MTTNKAHTASQPEIELSVLVPVMNEAGNIAALVEEICAAFAYRSFEIIYVDDASNDASPAELAATAAKVPQLRVLRHESRAGQSAAIRSALLVARGSLIAVLDGDGQNVPADLPNLEAALIARCPAGGDAVGMAAGIRAKRQDSAARLGLARREMDAPHPSVRYPSRQRLRHQDSAPLAVPATAVLQPYAPLHAKPGKTAWGAGHRCGCGAPAPCARHLQIPDS